MKALHGTFFLLFFLLFFKVRAFSFCEKLLKTINKLWHLEDDDFFSKIRKSDKKNCREAKEKFFFYRINNLDEKLKEINKNIESEVDESKINSLKYNYFIYQDAISNLKEELDNDYKKYFLTNQKHKVYLIEKLSSINFLKSLKNFWKMSSDDAKDEKIKFINAKIYQVTSTLDLFKKTAGSFGMIEKELMEQQSMMARGIVKDNFFIIKGFGFSLLTVVSVFFPVIMPVGLIKFLCKR